MAAAMPRRPNAGRIDARAAGVVGDGCGNHIDVLLPIVGLVVPEKNFAEAGTVNFDAWIARISLVVDTSPKTIPRPLLRRISPAPAWSDG